jgi:WD40 repeat protein
MRDRGIFMVYSIAALLAWVIPPPSYARGVHPSDKSVVVMSGELKTVRLVAFSADSRQIASADDKGNVEVWEMYPVQRVRTIKASSQVLAMAFSPDGQQLATSSADGKISVWKLGGDDLISSFDVTGGPAYSIGYTPDGSRIAAGCKDGAIRLYSADGELRHTFGDIVSGISVFLSPPGARIAAVELQGLQIWNAETGEALLIRTPDPNHPPSPHTRHLGLTQDPIFGISPGARFVAIVGQLAPGLAPPELYTLTIERAVSGEKVVELGALGWPRYSFSLQEDTIAAAAFSSISVTDLKTREEIHRFVYPKFLTSLSFSPDRKWIASGHDDGSVRIWDAQQPEDSPWRPSKYRARRHKPPRWSCMPQPVSAPPRDPLRKPPPSEHLPTRSSMRSCG